MNLSTFRFRRRAAAAGALVALGALAMAPSVSAQSAAPTTAAGVNEPILWIAVSPAYARTGLVVVTSNSANSCSGNCQHLWVSHDGGGSWSRSPATGWSGGRVGIALDSQGHEVLLSLSGNSLMRSNDQGASWSAIGAAGTPTTAPGFAKTGQIAVAGSNGSDYVLENGKPRTVSGSGGKFADFAFAYSPAYPSGGAYAPVLLSAVDSNKMPAILQCTADFTCTGDGQLPGAVTFAAPALLYTSTDYQHDGAVWVQSGRGIYKSTDGGKTFAPLPIIPANGSTATATPMLALADGYKESGPVRTAYAAVLQVTVDQNDAKKTKSVGGVYRTDDGGTSWRSVGSPSPLDSGSTAVAVAPDGRLFAGYADTHGNAGLLCTADNKTWHSTCAPLVLKGGSTSAGSGSGAGGAATPCSSCASATAVPAAVGGGSAGGGQGSAAGGDSAAVNGQTAGLHNASGDSPIRIILAVAALVVLAACGVGVIRSRRARRGSAGS